MFPRFWLHVYNIDLLLFPPTKICLLSLVLRVRCARFAKPTCTNGGDHPSALFLVRNRRYVTNLIPTHVQTRPCVSSSPSPPVLALYALTLSHCSRPSSPMSFTRSGARVRRHPSKFKRATRRWCDDSIVDIASAVLSNIEHKSNR